MEIKKKFFIKIPSDVSVFYCDKKKVLIFSGNSKISSLKLKVKVFFVNKKNMIKVSSLPFSNISNNEKKMYKVLQGTTCALIKQNLIEISATIYKKLKFIGVGYRPSIVDSFDNQLMLLKLGFSHLLYFKIPKNLKVFYKNRTQLFVFGNSYKLVTQFSSSIRMLKKPDPYKGKGILYENEKIILKEGKKI